MVIDVFSISIDLIHSSYHACRRKGEVDALMVALAGVVILAIIALIFVMVVGTSMDGAKDIICDRLAEDAGGAAGLVINLGTKSLAGCG
ncbi:MAG: hypothetical protein KAS11_02095 [Candidatus Aenigmarchaeota archaeon]|nr:hypothetical protein [Candidatus Aenigmarchaeota archaeon]